MIEETNLPKELFLPATPPREEEGEGGLSSRGFFRDAFIRLFKMTRARIALGTIGVILLFSLLMPLFIDRESSYMDPYYARLGPRISVLADRLGIMDARETRRLGESGAVRLAAIGIGAMGGDITLGESMESGLSPIISYGESDGRVREVVSDTYLAVGFIYRTVTREEHEKILAFERERGIQVCYPLIADNEYTYDRGDANAWYLANGRGEATAPDGSVIELSADMRLYDNYLRDGEGEAVFATPSGGGTAESAGVKIRVLYYNYYIYKTGGAPDYLFGTDAQGYDLALRLAGGIRLSLLIAVVVSIINFVIGAAFGAVEGYYGGAVDLVLERVTDVLSGVPFIVVATLFQIYLADKVGGVVSLLFAFVLTGWLGTANRVRAQFYRFKSSEYVLAARNLGASDRRIIWRHIFPNTLGTLITASALVIPGVIFTESMMSFLGIVNLGGESVTSLGTLLAEASGVWINYPHLMLFPALTISLLMIAFNIAGEGLREAFNPRTKGGV